ncbi:MFS transporter [Prochlorococcus sp. MIT 1223]|uniref:MFS transporter n=1 Tax=Prochlorococcus sp. MIT 1223 TaxID=3096217 RepID=UPI002A750ED3|nr:MFS transporter [Prochlorococcus sp. MIT 1223]
MRLSKIGILFCAFATLLNDRLGETVLLPLLPKLKTTFGISPVVLGLLAGTYAFSQFAVAPLIGAISDKYGRKPIIIICVAGSVLGLSLFALSIHIWDANLPAWKGGTPLILGLLFGARVIDGASGGTAATATAVLADISSPENRAKTFGIIGAAFGLGFIVGPLIGGYLTNINFSLPGIMATLFAIFNLILVITVLPETYKNKEKNIRLKKRDLNPVNQLIKVFKNPLINKLSFAFFLFFMAFNGLTSFLLLYQEEVFKWLGKEPVLIINNFIITKGYLPALSLAWVGVIAIVVQGGLIGKLVKQFGESRLTMSGIGFVITGCLLLVVANPANSIPMVFTACSFLAIGTGLVVPSLRAIISKKLTASGQGAVLGNLQGLQSLGSFLGALLAGAAYKNIGPSSPFWLGMFLLIGVGILISGGLTNIKKKTTIRSF